MNCASISDTAETPDSSSVRVVGSNNHSLSITDLPLTQEKVETTYADVFQGLGKFPGEPYKLRLKPDAVPVKHRPRRVPVHLQDAFHEEVERLVKIDVLEKVTEPTEWVNSFVIVEKVIDSSNAHSPNHVIKKSIRLCIDPKDLNEALEREPYYSRSIDELISMFAGAKVFTIVDMDKGYWQVVLHPESRKLTCMAFDIGRYQFKRLPMGSKVASNIFQRMLDSVYIGLPGVTGIADDMVIFGRNEEEHDRNLILFLETTRKNGLVLNKKKLQFKEEEVSFFGHRWNSTGISPDPKKTESILKMQFPPDKETMHSFLGLVNFLNRYTPKLAELCSPLRKLILKDSHYSPGDPEHAPFDAIKAEFKKKIILPYFDRHKETILQTDASKKGFGAVILQEEQPIYYASRALTSTEKNYQNLEREAQAAVWGMEKFHYFLYGRKFILQTDQKPLVSIFRKHMIDVSPRIQRITIRAWQYDFVPQHIPGRINVIADSLSRVTPLEFQDSNAEKDILAVNFLQYSSIEERERDEMLQETNKDEELQSLKHYISTGWPAKRSQIPVSLHPYWNFRDELTVESGILMKNSKVLIPESPAEILFGRKFRSSISILPSQVLNDRISKQRELIAKKEGKFYASTQDFQDRIKALPFEAGQNVWLQNSDSRKFEEAVIREKCREPNSYMVEIPATGQCFRRNSNFIKPRQTNKNSVSTDPLPTTGLPEIPQEPPVLQQPSSQATSTVDAIPTVPPSKQNDNSTPRTPRTPRQPRASRRSTKGIPPPRLGLQE